MLKGLKPSIDWLLIFLPVAFAVEYLPAFHNDTALFICSGLAIIPLAGIMGRATEHLAEHLGEGIGGLLNATFGNAAELIIALMALHKGLIGVVKASITGSIIGNILLVLGAAVLAGGIKYKRQRFNVTAARSQATLLTLAAISMIVPAAFHFLAGPGQRVREADLSLEISIVLLVAYAMNLLFSLHTHKQLFAGDIESAAEEGHPWSVKRSMLILAGATVL